MGLYRSKWLQIKTLYQLISINDKKFVIYPLKTYCEHRV